MTAELTAWTPSFGASEWRWLYEKSMKSFPQTKRATENKVVLDVAKQLALK